MTICPLSYPSRNVKVGCGNVEKLLIFAMFDIFVLLIYYCVHYLEIHTILTKELCEVNIVWNNHLKRESLEKVCKKRPRDAKEM